MIRSKAQGGLHRRWTGRVMPVAVGALLAGFVAAGPASADTPPAPVGNPIYGFGGLCLDDRGDVVADYNAVQLYTCSGTLAQDWSATPVGSIAFDNGLSDLCLDVYAGRTTDGTPVDIYRCNDSGAQTWVQRPGGALYNPQSGKCLDDPNWGGAGTQLDIWDCNGGANQNWSPTS